MVQVTRVKRAVTVKPTGIVRASWLGGAALGMALIATPAAAQQVEQYVPTVWVDPDGCEHWVMDDGVEGYMTPHVTRDGIPVCRRGNLCGEVNADQLFASNSAQISPAGKTKLMQFFRHANARSYIITGHTDSRASDAYNMDLSLRRASAVADVAFSAGAHITDIRGYGERKPKASNATARGQAQNRRVDIICIR